MGEIAAGTTAGAADEEVTPAGGVPFDDLQPVRATPPNSTTSRATMTPRVVFVPLLFLPSGGCGASDTCGSPAGDCCVGYPAACPVTGGWYPYGGTAAAGGSCRGRFDGCDSVLVYGSSGCREAPGSLGCPGLMVTGQGWPLPTVRSIDSHLSDLAVRVAPPSAGLGSLSTAADTPRRRTPAPPRLLCPPQGHPHPRRFALTARR